MEPERRIEELESQVKELTRVVQDLLDRQDEQKQNGDATTSVKRAATAAVERTKQLFREDVRRNVDRVLGGEEGDSLETRIGGIWLSRITVIMVMTAAVLGARVTFYSEVIGPMHKIAIGFGASMLAIAFGLARRQHQGFFPQTILGAGMAGLYFTTYAAFFLDETRVIAEGIYAVPSLLSCLLLIMGISHWRRSQTVAGIAMFLVYYTVMASCISDKNAHSLSYAFATCAVLAVAALIFHAVHRWLFFTWAALIATHGTYMYFFLAKPPGLAMSDQDYFWLSNGFLSVCYLLFTCACILDARKTGEYRRTVAPMAGVNSAVFFALTWVAVRQNYLDSEWMFRLAFAVCLLLFAILAETSGPKRNYLFQVFIAKAVIMFTLALQAYLSGEKLMVAMAIECLALALSYRRSGIVMFKVLGLLLLLVTFVACLFHVRLPGEIVLGGISLASFSVPEVTVRANWFSVLGTASVLALVAWFYERFVRKVQPEHRTTSGHWFLADTVLDLSSGSAAMLHAAAAALLLLTITIIDRGSDPTLPYLLAWEGAAMGVAGFLCFAPQLEIGGVLLLIAAHLCYHTFLAMGLPGFVQQQHYVKSTLIVAVFTYMGACLWERYLRRVQGGRPWEHHAVAAVPYLAATYMLTTLTAHQITGIQAPLVQSVLGVLLLLIGAMTHFSGIKASGLLALGVGAATFGWNLSMAQAPYTEQAGFLPYFALFLLAYVAAERLFVVLQRQEHRASKFEDSVRTMLIIAAASLGVFGCSLYASLHFLTVDWILLAFAAAVLGALFDEVRYRWTAILLFVAAIARAFSFDLRQMALRYAFLTFATASVALLVVTWAYSRYGQRSRRPSPGQDSATDE